MKIRHRSMAVGVGLVAIGLTVSTAWAKGDAEDGIGVITAVQGKVTVAHPNAASATPVKLHDDVLFKDIIETQNESRTKALLDDESLLTVGEHSRVEITEHIYDPAQNKRSMVVKLVHGRLRALVSKIFTGSGSKFEVHTPTAVAAARGTYFVVWFENGISGAVNIGNSGRVDFTSEEQTVSLMPGQFSTALSGGIPASPIVFRGVVPPGLAGTTPGQAGTAPGRAGTTPGQSGMTPSEGAPPPGEAMTTPGQAGTTPGQSGMTPGQSGAQAAGILASIRNAVEGTELMDTPAGTAIRAIPAIPATPATRAAPGGQGIRATPATPATPAVPAVPAVISGAANAHPSHPLGGPPGLAGGGPRGGPPIEPPGGPPIEPPGGPPIEPPGGPPIKPPGGPPAVISGAAQGGIPAGVRGATPPSVPPGSVTGGLVGGRR